MAASLILIALVLLAARRTFSTWVFCALLLAVGSTGFLIFGMRSSPNIQEALPWDRAATVIGLAIFVFYYHFTLAYTRIRGQRRTLLASYLFLMVVAALASTDLVIERMRLEWYGYAPVLGIVGFLVVISILILIGAGAYNLLRRYKLSSSYEEKNRIIYLIIAIIFPLTGGFLDGLTNLPPAGIWGNLLLCIVCSVAILKYHLLDIRVVVRKGLVYVLTSIMVAIPYASILLLLNQILKARIEPWWAHAFIILLLAILLRPLYSRAQQFVDRLLYRDRYDYLQALQHFSREAQSVTDLTELSSKMVKLIRGALRCSIVCLLLPSEDTRDFTVASCAGLQAPVSGVVLRQMSPIVKRLEYHEDVLSSKNLHIIPQLQSLSLSDKTSVERLDAELYIALKTHEGRLCGILTLGRKHSEQLFSSQEKELLVSLCSQMAMVLENARLYNSALQVRYDLERLLESMTDCIVISDTGYTTVFMNKAATEKLGTGVGQKCWQVMGKEGVCGECPLDEYVRGELGSLQFTHCIRGKVFETASAPLVNPNGSLSIIEVLRDITERQQLEQRAQLASRLAAIGEMAAGVAHEINNPLAGVVGFSQLLMRKDIPEDIRRYVETINDGGQRVADIVKRLLTFARQQKPTRVYVNINEALEKALKLRAYVLETNNIEVTPWYAPDLPWTMADPGQLQQVFLNIIVNAETAIKQACDGGKLLIKTETKDENIFVSIKDDGSGIAPEHLERIFEPFFTTREVGEGTGLGLSLCHGIIAEHNGRIYVESELGKGTTFIIELPIVTKEEQTIASRSVSRSRATRQAKILVIDDEQMVQDFLSELLTGEGHEVKTACAAKEALRTIKEEEFDLIFLDIKLPHMSGRELYYLLLQASETLTNRVVFVTGDIMSADTKEFLDDIQAKYITKPFDIEQLLSEVEQILKQPGD